MTSHSQSSPGPDYVQALGAEDSVWFKLSFVTAHPDPMRVMLRIVDKYDGCVPVTLKDERILFLARPEHVKQVLVTRADSYGKYVEGLRPVFGNALVTVDGALWQKIRMPQQAAFQPKMYNEYVPHLLAALDGKAREWEGLAASGATVNMLEETWGLAAGMVCRALFDRDVPFNRQAVFAAVKMFTDVSRHRMVRLKKTGGELTEVPRGEGLGAALEAWLSVPAAVLGAEALEHREQTLLRMLEAAAADPGQPEFTPAQMVDEVKQYLWAGTETTALTLSWCFYLLSVHPEAAERVRREGEAVLGGRAPAGDDIQALSYTRAVIQETMRLYPPVWSIIRVALEEDEIGGHKVRPGDKIVLSTYAIHHSPQYWDNPELFDPDRFAPGTEGNRAPHTYLPFGAGKRVCIGGALSLVENTLALTRLLRRFRPEYLGEVPARIGPTVTLTPADRHMPFRIRTVE
jgi:enediyne biosynthesis protein E7